jgi:hypothetical protein
MNPAAGGRRYLLLIYDEAIPEARVEAVEENGRWELQPPIPSKREREGRKNKGTEGGEVGSVSCQEVS